MAEFKRTQHDYPLSFKIAVVEQVEKGEITYKQAQLRLGMKAVRRRISGARFMTLLWKTIKARHIDVGLFRAASEGVPQGGVISPLLSNIMLNEFDQYLHERFLIGKARKDRWYWNNSKKYCSQEKLGMETRRSLLPL